MSRLNSQMRAMLRRETLKYLNDTCTIEQQSSVVSEIGAPVLAWATVASGVPCRVITAKAQNDTMTSQVGDRESIQDMYRIIVPAADSTYTWDLDVDQRITVSDGTVYQVIALLDGRSDETDRQCIVMRQR